MRVRPPVGKRLSLGGASPNRTRPAGTALSDSDGESEESEDLAASSPAHDGPGGHGHGHDDDDSIGESPGTPELASCAMLLGQQPQQEGPGTEEGSDRAGTPPTEVDGVREMLPAPPEHTVTRLARPAGKVGLVSQAVPRLLGCPSASSCSPVLTLD